MYRGNLLASDGMILSRLSEYVPEALIINVKDALMLFLAEHFSGRYCGYVGVDMFICREHGGFRLAPCVEINVRMTMGLLARRICDLHLPSLTGRGLPEADGMYEMRVEYSPSPEALQSVMHGAVAVVVPYRAGGHYAIAVFPARQR